MDANRKFWSDYSEREIGIEIHAVEVTPELANEWLTLRNSRNRKVNNRAVDEWVLLMREGAWSPSASQIHFDSDGMLVNGQHRLLAVSASGEPCVMTIITGCNPGDYLKVDTGRSRYAAQFLEGKYASERAIAARILYMVRVNGRFSAGPIPMEIQVDYETRWDGELTAFAPHCKYAARYVGFPASVFLAVMAQAVRGSYIDKIPEFLSGCATGEGLFRGDPRMTLIRRGHSYSSDEVKGSYEGRYGMPYRYVALAWNSFAQGKERHVFRGPFDTIPKVL